MNESRYTLSNNDEVLRFLELRKIQSEAKFILPYTSDYDNVLDYGCGTGKLLQGLFKYFPNISLTGIDTDEKVINIANNRVRTGKYSINSKYDLCDVRNLTYSDNEFDQVFGHSILMQLDDVQKAISEVRRVLKKGGFACFREPDYSMDIYQNATYLKKFWFLFCKSLESDGGNPYMGATMPKLFKRFGLKILSYKIEYFDYKNLFNKKKIFIDFINHSPIIYRAHKLGLIDRDLKTKLASKISAEISSSNFYCKRAYFEIVAQKK